MLTARAMTRINIALCQFLSGPDKALNIKAALDAVGTAASKGVQLIALPECWNSPYDTSCFAKYSEVIPERASDLSETDHPSTWALSKAAKDTQTYIVGGSIPEREGDNIYNTCVVFDDKGSMIAKHRKMHLFDIDVPGKIKFKESDALTAGSCITCVDTPFCKLGIAICFDLRFPELSQLMRDAGCNVLVFPGAFNLTTGPAHWELLARARAVDTQCYVCAVSPARNTSPDYTGYKAWGHSTVVDPWGEIIATTEHDPAIVYAELDMDRLEEVRASIPVGIQRRRDVYRLEGLN